MKPKHNKSSKLINNGLFDNLLIFSELENRISSLPEQDRGDAFEVFAEAYFTTQKISQAAEVWPDKEIPISLRKTLGLFKRDMGVDGIFHTKENQYHAYQVKFRSQRTSLTWDELSTFMGLTDRFHKRVLFTNSCNLPPLMQDRTEFYAIKGYDLDALKKEDFQKIEDWLKSGTFICTKKDLRSYQEEAKKQIVSALQANNRTTAIMACGTGKTRVSLRVTESMNVNSVVVFVPSLALVRQLLHEWMKETVWEDLSFLCICSDKTVTKGVDEIVLHQGDLDFPVTTNSKTVLSFLQQKSTQKKIIFCTYKSSPILAEGLPLGYSFDLGIFDEAHKTTGREGTASAFALNNKNLSIKKRLFLTATPKHYDISKRDAQGNLHPIFSMDNSEIYGNVSYKLPFSVAANTGIICLYKIVISIVTDESITRDLLKKGEVLSKGGIVKANQIARIFALQRAIEQFNAKKIFTFHNSVESAKSFTSESGEGIGAYLLDFKPYHVNGKMPTSHRELILREFKLTEKAVISNARCLTEGVDVPAVDMVAFMSPKESQTDIVQAAGRAMRKNPNDQSKQIGYILLPIHLQVSESENLEKALEDTQFKEVWNVLQAMLDQDENLVEIIRQMREDLGKKGGFDDSRLRERLEFIGPELEIDSLRRSITAIIVDKLSSSWDENYGELIKFKDKVGHCNIPETYSKKLNSWVGFQRTHFKKNQLSQEKIQKLNEIGFDWNPLETSWEQMFSALVNFKKEHGHCNVPQKSSQNSKLATWVNTQRTQYKESQYLPERKKRMDELGFVWDTNIHAWETKFSELCVFKQEHGHCNVPQRFPQNRRLATWVGTQRDDYKEEKITKERELRLNEIGFQWNPSESSWNEMFSLLRKYKEEHGDCNIPPKFLDRKLSAWVSTQRAAYKDQTLSLERINKLEEISFVLDPLNSLWNELYDELSQFKIENGHCNVPKEYAENKRLGAWVANQRRKYSQNKLSKERLNKLNQIGFTWNTLIENWESMYADLIKFKDFHGHTSVSKNYKTSPQLSTWVGVQRKEYKFRRISKERLEKLNALGFDWNPKNNAWDSMYLQLKKNHSTDSKGSISRNNKNTKKLAHWISIQRRDYKNKHLPKERIAKLGHLGFKWDPYSDQWEIMFDALTKYKQVNGDCNVSQKDKKHLELARWIGRQRNAYKKNLLPEDRIQRLNSLNFKWDMINDSWEAMFNQLLEFKKTRGHSNVPQSFQDNPKLGTWLAHQRDHYKQCILTSERKSKLDKMGVCWDPLETAWERMFSALVNFKKEHGHCNVPRASQLARWIQRQRTSYKNTTLHPNLREKLEKIGIDWEPFASYWENMFKALSKFQKENGHCNVPAKYHKNLQLGRWLDRQRQSYRNGKLKRTSIDQLEQLGVLWNPIHDSWEEIYLQLCEFIKKYGRSNITKNDAQQKLLSWINWQRYSYKKGKLSNDQILKLKQIGIL